MASFVDTPVDAVYTWVDEGDPAWQRRRQAAQQTLGVQPAGPPGNDRAPPSPNQDLRFSLRSLAACLPWIRHVYIITDGQCPPWIDTAHVTIVDHQDIFPKDAELPTFNSHAIELCQHRIAGLSECFLSFNDDFVIGKSIDKECFFTGSKQPIIWAVRFRAKHRDRLLSEDYDAMSPHDAGDIRARQMILKTYGDYMPFRIRHYPRSMTRSIMEEIWEVFPEEVHNTLSSPFRSVHDIAIHALFPYFSISRQRARLRVINGGRQVLDALSGNIRHMGATMGNDNFFRKLWLMRILKPWTLCLNHGGSSSPADREAADSFLHRLYPDRSRFETS